MPNSAAPERHERVRRGVVVGQELHVQPGVGEPALLLGDVQAGVVGVGRPVQRDADRRCVRRRRGRRRTPAARAAAAGGEQRARRPGRASAERSGARRPRVLPTPVRTGSGDNGRRPVLPPSQPRREAPAGQRAIIRDCRTRDRRLASLCVRVSADEAHPCADSPAPAAPPGPARRCTSRTSRCANGTCAIQPSGEQSVDVEFGRLKRASRVAPIEPTAVTLSARGDSARVPDGRVGRGRRPRGAGRLDRGPRRALTAARRVARGA